MNEKFAFDEEDTLFRDTIIYLTLCVSMLQL